MSSAPILYWLPPLRLEEWRKRLALFESSEAASWSDAVALSMSQLNFTLTNRLDAALAAKFGTAALLEMPQDCVRLATLGSATLSHLHPAIRVAGLRRGLRISTYDGLYGQHIQELSDPRSGLRAFAPHYVLFSFDARRMTSFAGSGTAVRDAVEELRISWRMAKDNFGCGVLQQTALPVFPPLLGENEHRLEASRADMVRRLNSAIREAADTDRVDIVAIDARVSIDGIGSWHDSAQWHRTKQEIMPAAAPMYGELMARVLAAKRGCARKVLVLDLDNTLWGGVIGDDGVDGIALGQGSGLGEAFLEIQRYASDLSKRGVVLAVCSKNDLKNAEEAFQKHPEIILKMSDFGAFVCNWDPKPSNLRVIAEALNLGLDSLVFLDDNPFEREHVRAELPMVAVPEVSDEPATYPQTLADAGYFEAFELSNDDLQRTQQYQANLMREAARSQSGSVEEYLSSLQMKLFWNRVDKNDIRRPTQLINKTNQFNLTTKRVTEEGMASHLCQDGAIALQFRLTDRFGDNGVIAVVTGLLRSDELEIDNWVMSCRVLGRQVEVATLNVLRQCAMELGATRIVGEYRPTTKNGMVSDHYDKLEFARLSQPSEFEFNTVHAGITRYAFLLDEHNPRPTSIEIVEDRNGRSGSL